LFAEEAKKQGRQKNPAPLSFLTSLLPYFLASLPPCLLQLTANRYKKRLRFRAEVSMNKLLCTTNEGTLTVMRLLAGIVFFAHGAQKALGWFGGFGFSGTMGFFTNMMHVPAAFAFLAIMAEFLGGMGLIVGFLARIAAFGITVNMLVAIMMVHSHVGFFMNWSGKQNGEGFEFHLLAIAIMIAIMVRGAGALSIDRALAGKSAAST
jgi:putative oxidoreductase